MAPTEATPTGSIEVATTVLAAPIRASLAVVPIAISNCGSVYVDSTVIDHEPVHVITRVVASEKGIITAVPTVPNPTGGTPISMLTSVTAAVARVVRTDFPL